MKLRIILVITIVFLGIVLPMPQTVKAAATNPTPPSNMHYHVAGDNSSIEITWDKGYCRAPAIVVNDSTNLPSRKAFGAGAQWGIQHWENNTYFVFGEYSTLDPVIVYYNGSTDTMSASVEIDDGGGGSNEHKKPGLIIDDDGYLHVFYGCWATAMKYAKSNNPGDISSWTLDNQLSDASSATYPKPMRTNNGDLWVFYRCCGGSGSGDMAYVYSQNGGASWSSYRQCVGGGTGYSTGYGFAAYENETGVGKFHVVHTKGDSVHQVNLYYFWFYEADRANPTFYNESGVNLGNQVSDSEMTNQCLIYLSKTQADNEWEVKTGSGTIFCTPDKRYHYGTFAHGNFPSDMTGMAYEWENGTKPDQNDIYNISTDVPVFLHHGSMEVYNEKCVELFIIEDNDDTSGHVAHYIYNGSVWRFSDNTWSESYHLICDTSFEYDNKYNIMASEWENGSSEKGRILAKGAKVYTEVRYSTSNNLTTHSAGSLLCNHTGQNETFSVPSNGTYYFRAWSYTKIAGWNTTGSSTLSVEVGNGTGPGPEPSGDIIINSINNETNGSSVQALCRWFNWTVVENATAYRLVIANGTADTPNWNEEILNLSNITVSDGYCSNNFLNTSASASYLGYNYWETDDGNYVIFYLPYLYNITYTENFHYYRVSAQS